MGHERPGSDLRGEGEVDLALAHGMIEEGQGSDLAQVDEAEEQCQEEDPGEAKTWPRRGRQREHLHLIGREPAGVEAQALT